MLTAAELQGLVALLHEGGVVACATETFFGLLANALDPVVVHAVCALKGRDSGSPVAVLLPDMDALESVCDDVTERARSLAGRYWPGPLTLLVPARSGLPAPLVSAGKIGVRVPGPSAALQLVRAFGAPLTATSANVSGEPAARTAQEVLRVFPSGLAAVAGREAPGGLASSIVDTTGERLTVVRAGPILVPLGGG